MSFDWSWITVSASSTLMVGLSAVGIYLAIIVFTRLSGLRSFSKMSSFDFATTVAFGSVLAGTVLTKDPPLFQGIVALGSIFLLQHIVSSLRIGPGTASRAVDNPPILVMAGREILEENLKKAQMTKDDLFAKLREANVTSWAQVQAVVVESTGDVSVLHASSDGSPLEPSLLSDVRGADRIQPSTDGP